MTRLVSKPFTQEQVEDDSMWPPRYGTADKSPCYIDRNTGKLVKGRPKRQYVQSVAIRTDEMKPTECMANGRVYTSKRKYKDAIKAHGYELTEGERVASPKNERLENEKHEAEVAGDIEKAYHQVKNGSAPLTELDKHWCQVNNRVIKNKSGR